MRENGERLKYFIMEIINIYDRLGKEAPPKLPQKDLTLLRHKQTIMCIPIKPYKLNPKNNTKQLNRTTTHQIQKPKRN